MRKRMNTRRCRVKNAERRMQLTQLALYTHHFRPKKNPRTREDFLKKSAQLNFKKIFRKIAGYRTLAIPYSALLARPGRPDGSEGSTARFLPAVTWRFCHRSPNRPNPIGIGVVKFLHRDRSKLVAKGIDALDGAPFLDIKPYSAGIDCIKD
jgi:hypothetical protein